MDELNGLLELLKNGGNAATIGLLYFAWKVAGGLKELLQDLHAGQEQIKRAIIVSNPETARIFEETQLKKP